MVSDTLQITGTWCLSNLCRGSPPPSFEFSKRIVPTLFSILNSPTTKDHVKTDACWAISHISEAGPQHIQFLLHHELPKYILPLLNDSSKTRLISPIIRIIGNITFGDDSQIQYILDSGVIPYLLNIFRSSTSENVLRELCWVLSNFAAGTIKQSNQLLKSSIMEDLISKRSKYTPISVLKEMAWIITNIASNGDQNQIITLVNRGAIQFICDLLSMNDGNLLFILIEGLEYIFSAGDKISYSDLNPFTSILEEAGGILILHHLADSENPTISNHVSSFLERILPDDDMDDEFLVPPINNLTNEFVFGTTL